MTSSQPPQPGNGGIPAHTPVGSLTPEGLRVKARLSQPVTRRCFGAGSVSTSLQTLSFGCRGGAGALPHGVCCWVGGGLGAGMPPLGTTSAEPRAAARAEQRAHRPEGVWRGGRTDRPRPPHPPPLSTFSSARSTPPGRFGLKSRLSLHDRQLRDKPSAAWGGASSLLLRSSTISRTSSAPLLPHPRLPLPKITAARRPPPPPRRLRGARGRGGRRWGGSPRRTAAVGSARPRRRGPAVSSVPAAVPAPAAAPARGSARSWARSSAAAAAAAPRLPWSAGSAASDARPGAHHGAAVALLPAPRLAAPARRRGR